MCGKGTFLQIRSHMSMSEVEISFIAPTYSSLRLSDDDCNSPQQTEQVHSNPLCSAVEVSADQQMPTNSIPQNPIVLDAASTPILDDGHQSLWCGFKIVMDNVDKNFRT